MTMMWRSAALVTDCLLISMNQEVGVMVKAFTSEDSINCA